MTAEDTVQLGGVRFLEVPLRSFFMNNSLDCTFLTEQGNFNFRIGVIIMNERKVLMVRNPNSEREYYYSVGGRVKLGESLTQSVVREVQEETGIICEVDKMAAIHENFFNDDDGVPFHEISVFFTLKPNKELLSLKNGTLTDQGPHGEYLQWIDLDNCENVTIYPKFFKTLDLSDINEIKHFIDREE